MGRGVDQRGEGGEEGGRGGGGEGDDGGAPTQRSPLLSVTTALPPAFVQAFAPPCFEPTRAVGYNALAVSVASARRSSQTGTGVGAHLLPPVGVAAR